MKKKKTFLPTSPHPLLCTLCTIGIELQAMQLVRGRRITTPPRVNSSVKLRAIFVCVFLSERFFYVFIAREFSTFESEQWRAIDAENLRIKCPGSRDWRYWVDILLIFIIERCTNIWDFEYLQIVSIMDWFWKESIANFDLFLQNWFVKHQMIVLLNKWINWLVICTIDSKLTGKCYFFIHSLTHRSLLIHRWGKFQIRTHCFLFISCKLYLYFCESHSFCFCTSVQLCCYSCHFDYSPILLRVTRHLNDSLSEQREEEEVGFFFYFFFYSCSMGEEASVWTRQ